MDRCAVCYPSNSFECRKHKHQYSLQVLRLAKLPLLTAKRLKEWDEIIPTRYGRTD